MVGERTRGKEIRAFILQTVNLQPSGIAKAVCAKFDITRQAAHYHLNKLVGENALRKTGQRKECCYWLNRQRLESLTLKLDGLEEHVVWEEHISGHLTDLPSNIRSICQYGFTEMLNNAIDHSESTHVSIYLDRSSVDVAINIVDRGEGIFKRICRLKDFENEHIAIFELAKGKLTTDPDRHTGEGIFFSSRMFDLFCIRSGGLYFSHDIEDDGDWLLETSQTEGTKVIMEISNVSKTIDQEVFDSFADPDNDPSFHKTIVPVALAQYKDEGLVSRSQAKRILNRFDRFSTVMLDFKNVPSVGQAFADEIFRVFTNAHPEIELIEVNANTRVSNMIKRAKNTSQL